MKTSLLRKAKASERKPDTEKATFAVAWMADEISFTQAQSALDAKPGSGVYAVLACGLRDAFRLGMLERKA